jgi:hypothetical protein
MRGKKSAKGHRMGLYIFTGPGNFITGNIKGKRSSGVKKMREKTCKMPQDGPLFTDPGNFITVNINGKKPSEVEKCAKKTAKCHRIGLYLQVQATSSQ